MEKNAKMSHKLVKRCACQPSQCSCAPIQLTLKISCSCPQICECTSPAQPIYPPVTYTMPPTTLPPITYTLPPVTYTLPPITPAPIIPTQSPYCCVLFICAGCSYYGSSYNVVNFKYFTA
uniref:TIL domain-containing protein n=1 Tax=Elaeophora elaphi TaxID=1147741 RepID=A0A0R3RI49_9BILA